MLRLCIDDKKSDRSSIQKGKMPSGICLRDISELRLGCDAFNFKNVDPAKKEEDCCFSIIGSERTLSMITPTKVRLQSGVNWLSRITVLYIMHLRSIRAISFCGLCNW